MTLRCQSKLLVSNCVHKRISQLKGGIVSKFVLNAKSYVANIMQLLLKATILLCMPQVSFSSRLEDRVS
jgi:hypothetical protein